MKHPFIYTVQGNRYDEHKSVSYVENGIGLCKSYQDAASLIEKYYGDELIAIKHIELYEESTLITLPHKVFKEVATCLNSGQCYEIEVKTNED